MAAPASFLNALSLSLIRDCGWVDVPLGGELLEHPAVRLLAGPKDALLLVRAEGVEGVEALRVERQFDEWYLRLQQGRVPATCRSFAILYVCDHAPSPTLRARFTALRKHATSGKRLLVSGWASPTDGGFGLRVGWFSPVRRTAARLLREMHAARTLGAGGAANATDSAASTASASASASDAGVTDADYRRAVAAEDRRIRDFLGRAAETRPWATWGLAAACIVMHLASQWVFGGADDNLDLLRFGANYGPLVRHGEWWRLVGATFLHAGLLHLAVNLMTLLAVGRLLEQFFGTRAYLALYGCSGLAGSLASVLWRDVLSIGASGALFGLFGAAACLGVRYRREIPARLRVRIAGEMLPCIGYNLAFGLLLSGLIDNAAHIGGLVGGVLFALVVRPAASVDRPQRTTSRAAATALLLLAVLPLVTEGYVLARAFRYPTLGSYPDVEFQDDAKRFSFRYPSSLLHRHGADEDVFSVPGFRVSAAASEGRFGKNANAENDDFVRSLEAGDGFVVDRRETRFVNGRDWLLVAVRRRQNDTEWLRVAFVVEGRLRFHFLARTGAGSAAEGEEILRRLMESFRAE